MAGASCRGQRCAQAQQCKRWRLLLQHRGSRLAGAHSHRMPLASSLCVILCVRQKCSNHRNGARSRTALTAAAHYERQRIERTTRHRLPCRALGAARAKAVAALPDDRFEALNLAAQVSALGWECLVGELSCCPLGQHRRADQRHKILADSFGEWARSSGCRHMAAVL